MFRSGPAPCDTCVYLSVDNVLNMPTFGLCDVFDAPRSVRCESEREEAQVARHVWKRGTQIPLRVRRDEA